jgi:peptidoglycan/LPS O-acetylase OafA/YrhL
MALPNEGNRTGPKGAGEVLSLTSLRGFLAVWVVFYHYWSDVLLLFPGMAVFSPIVRIGHVAVPVFFMLSGFVLAYNYAARFERLSAPDVFRFLALRWARIYPVHLFSLLVVLGMVWVSRRRGYDLTWSGYTAGDFVRNLFLVHTWVPRFELNWNYPSWSISSEWFAYLMFPPAVALLLRHLVTPFRAITFGIMAAIASGAVMCWWEPWPFGILVRVVPSFLAGASVFWIVRRPAASPPGAWRWVPELLVVALAAGCFLPSESLSIPLLLVGFFGLLVLLVWLEGQCHRGWISGPAVFLGEVSYSLYMTHTLVQKVVYRLMPAAKVAKSGAGAKLGLLAVYAVAVVVACLATYYLIEAPSRRYFRKRLSRGPRPVAAPAV